MTAHHPAPPPNPRHGAKISGVGRGRGVVSGTHNAAKRRYAEVFDRALRHAYIPLTMSKANQSKPRNLAENRRARYDYSIEDDLECGIVLMGSEVKSLREGGANIAESYASVEQGELWLINSRIAPYERAQRDFAHDERRKRKLLVSKRELSRLWNETQRKGMTLVPMSLYFNAKGRAKLKLGLAKGKKTHDKRATEAKRDWNRQKQRLLRERG